MYLPKKLLLLILTGVLGAYLNRDAYNNNKASADIPVMPPSVSGGSHTPPSGVGRTEMTATKDAVGFNVTVTTYNADGSVASVEHGSVDGKGLENANKCGCIPGPDPTDPLNRECPPDPTPTT